MYRSATRGVAQACGSPITMEKPNASTTHTVYLGLGSNLGERRSNLSAAINALSPQVLPIQISPIYETEPWGYEDQPHFLNQVLEGHTRLAPGDLLTYLKRIERNLGREESFTYGPRVIDIDILYYDDLVLESPELTVPHPYLHERAFVLIPLADIAPDLIHPVLKKSVRELARGLNRSGVLAYE